MKILLLLCFLSFGAFPASTQIIVRNVTEHPIKDLPYPNQTMKTFSSQPMKGTVTLKDGSTLKGNVVCFKKDEKLTRVKVNTDSGKKEVDASLIQDIKLDPTITEQKHPNDYKNPEKNFQNGYMLLIDGVTVKGKIAQNRNLGDYGFFVYSIFFLPEGSRVASTVKGGALREFGQEIDGKTMVWDGYADGYLKRLVDGRYRLARNPYSSTKNEFFTSLKNQSVDSLSKSAAQEAFARGIESGKDVNESIENSVNAAEVVQALGTIEINRKEYLILDTKTNILKVVNKDTFKEYAPSLMAPCKDKIPSEPKAQKEFMSWDNIEAFVRFLNESCNQD